MEVKHCPGCSRDKPLAEFSRDRSRKDGLRPMCKACDAERARQWKAANPDKARESVRNWVTANYDRKLELNRRYREVNPDRAQASYRRFVDRHPGWNREKCSRFRQRDREAVFGHYGRTCACCGSTKRLNINHVNGDGKQKRHEYGYGSGARFYRWLVANGFPEGFQTLCFPCNRSKADGERCRLTHAEVTR